MEADRDTNHNQPSPYIIPTFSDLVSVSHISQVFSPYPDDATGDPYFTCWSLSGAINQPSVHSPLPEKGL